MLELAMQASDPLAMGATAIGLALAAFFSGLVIERRRNGRRNNPGPNADDYRHGGKRGSDCKPGHGKVCEKHGEKIEAHGNTIAALGSDQAAFYREQQQLRTDVREMRTETRDSFKGLHKRLDMLLPHKDP